MELQDGTYRNRYKKNLFGYIHTKTECSLTAKVVIVRWHKDNQFGIEFLRYAQGVRERVTDLVEGRETPAIANQPVEAELALSTVAA